MLRRRHKKSKAGCLQCKTRHIKCDENHPECVNCSTAGMKCSFTSQSRQVVARRENETRIATLGSQLRSSTPSVDQTCWPAAVLTEPYVNATHIEIFFSALEGGEWAYGYDPTNKAQPHVLKHAFTHPFLLNEFLAVSALHLSTQRPMQQALYRDESTRLQSHALRMFNETVKDLDAKNIIPAFLFSGLLGLATLYETFHDSPHVANDSNIFEKIIQSMRLLQGVRTIIDGWWEFLLSSEIKHLLDDGASPMLDWTDDAVRQFESFRSEVSNMPNLEDNEAVEYDEAMEVLIWTYKSAFADESLPIHDQAAGKHAMRWFIAISPAYTEFIAQKKPVALLILGHVSVMLHRLRGCWTVGCAGQKLLSVVEANLEENWRPMLLWPKQTIHDE